ncbi:hypothetical protein LPC08_14830 [Roseomonas sp. OT10]|uniref:2-keto-4-pentenoate hydratase n=1 Tax=Roseomonas cutis TaxID=2897332 RepID=UPI001E4883D8|nr:fumarylacetoacetate hydrolase family protein [Roseomonas sp. OT10]UFN47297.1 hypothetical protein LPC08_14830 [Roseomonas sp. OT10]
MADPLESILAARRAVAILAPVPPGDAPADLAAGYALQRRLAERWGEVPPAGFKIGATAQHMQRYLGLGGPVAAFVGRSGLREREGSFRFADHVEPGVECEIGLRLARDIPFGTHAPASLADSVGEVFAAIEVVDRRYNDLGLLGTPMLVADQVFHAGGVTGAPAPGWRALDLAGTRGHIEVDGSFVHEGLGAELLGHPLNALAWLAGSGAAEAFGGLRAGQVVFLGSVTPPIWLEGRCTVRAAFEGLGEAVARFE